MSKHITLFFIIFSSIIFSQQIKIVDAENQKPIPYAKLILKDKDYYKNTEENGETTLNEGEEISEIQSFGYENLKVEKYQTVFMLKPKFVEIEEVEIARPKFEKTFIVGSIKNSNMGFSASKTSWIIVDLFNNELTDEKIYIKKIKIPTEVRRNIKEAKFNLVFYDNENGKPSAEKIKNMVVSCKTGKNITEIDLSTKPIPFPKEGLFIGFEWIINEQNKYTYKTTVIHPDGTKEKNVTIEGISPSFKGHKSKDSNIFWNSNTNWNPIFNLKLVNNSNYSISLELELTN